MPRTKMSKESKMAKDKELKLKEDFKKKTSAEIKKMEIDLEREKNNLINAIQMKFSQLPTEIRSMTLSETLQLFESSDEEDTSTESIYKSRLTRTTTNRAAASDDGYATDKTRSYLSKVRFNKTEDKQKSMISVKSAKKKKSNIYAHTPSNRNQQKVMPVTPKVCPNTPLNVLRRPRNGETVISMTGSPLLVASNVQEDKMVNLNVPLDNGDVISLLPTGNLRQSMLPEISPRTREQLRTLKSHIEKFIS